MAFDPSSAKPLPGGFDPSSAKPAQEEGAAFGIYPRQRATPSRPETKEAVLKASESAAKGLEALGVFPPIEKTPDGLQFGKREEFDPSRVGTSTALGAGAGAFGPKALQAIGKGIQYIPTKPAKTVGAGIERLGQALGTTPAITRTLGGATAFGVTDVGGQLAEKAGFPGMIGMYGGAAALEKLPEAARAVGRAAVGTTQPEVSALAKKFEDKGYILEPAQVRADRPLASPGFMEAAKIKNEKLATKEASAATGVETQNITPAFIGDRLKSLGKDYDQIFNRNFTIDGELVQRLKTIRDFERSINPAGVGPVTSTADNIIARYQQEVIAARQKGIENRIRQIMQQQQRGGVDPIVRLRKDWPTITKADDATSPEWAKGVQSTIQELSDNLGLKATPQVWFGSPRREGLYGMATGDGHIIINNKLDAKGAVATALHEFGHQAEFQLFIHAPYEQRNAVVKAFNEQMASIPVGSKTVQQHRPITSEKYGEKARTGIPDPGFEKGYLRDFSEWFAEQTSRWITTTQKPTDLVEKFFAKVADSWKKIYQTVTGYIPLTSEVDKFFRANWKGDLIETAGAESGAITKAAMDIPADASITAKIDGKELQRLRQNISALARKAQNSDDRRAAGELLKVIDESLGKYDPSVLKKLQETNGKYAATIALQDGIERGFVTQGKISPQGLGKYLASTTYGYGSGTSRHPLYELGYGGNVLNIRSRAEGVDYPGYDATAALLGRGKQAVSSVVGGRSQLARSLQRNLSEQEQKGRP
jgi:hypothetical protein